MAERRESSCLELDRFDWVVPESVAWTGCKAKIVVKAKVASVKVVAARPFLKILI